MSCSNGNNNNSNSVCNCHQKSCQRYYNNNAQALTAGASLQLIIAGSRVVDSGISINTQNANYEILKAGLYHISADVDIDTTTAGNAVFSAYLDGVQLPCTVKAVALAEGNSAIHTETDLVFNSCCCNVNHSITFVLESETAAGTVNTFCSGVIKEA